MNRSSSALDDFDDFDDFDLDDAAPAAGPAHAPMRGHDPGEFAAPGFVTDGGDRPIPAIDIIAFADLPQTRQLIETCAADRRLAGASVTVLDGGLNAAVEYLAANPSPDLLIVESRSPGGRLIQELEQLAEHCEPKVKVLVVGAANDILLYRELMRRGVSDYVVPPIQPVQLIRSIGSLYADPDAPFLGKTVAVMGVKGGVGASTIAHNLAYTLGERVHVATTLVDLDLSFGTAALDFNQEPTQGVGDALSDPERVDDAVLQRLLTVAGERLRLFASSARLDRIYETDATPYSTIIDQVRRSAPFVVLDLPHQWQPWIREVLQSADEILLVAGPDLASLRNAKNVVDIIRTARKNDAPPKLVINMTGVPKRPEVPVKEFANAVGLEPALVLPFDPGVFGAAANNGQMIAEVDPKSKIAEGLDHLAGAISGRTPVAEKKQGLSRFLKLKK